MTSRFLSFFALYFGLGFASPLLVTLANQEDIAFDPLKFSIAALTLVLIASTLSYLLSAKTNFARLIATASLSCAFVFAIQGNVVHDIFYYGDFNGSLTDWRQYGWVFWLEWIGFILAFPLFFWLLNKFRQIPVLVTLVPIVSSILMIAPILLKQQDNIVFGLSDDDVNSDVLEFSSELNLIHLLPDGFQGDIVREVLEDHAELAARLQGFTLYRDHLGMYQGTAPSVPAIFTGRPFDFEAGYDIHRTMDEMKHYAYPIRLLENGFRLDYVTLSSAYCVEGATSCISRPFNDLKARGYFRHSDEHYSYAIRQLADLTLFRHLPMFLKERIYNNGDWFFADTTLDGSSPWPDPVIREWTDKMVVAGPQPRYKWYHYIGAHIPPHWDENCVFNRELERTRQQYYDQSVCVLTGIAGFVDRLRELGIFDQTAIIISGDHGVNIKPDDQQGLKVNDGLQYGLLGAARPALLVKPLQNRENFQLSDLPTQLFDIAPTALELVGLESDYPGKSVLSMETTLKRTRAFNWYTSAEFWSGEPISYDTWQVDGAVSDVENWTLVDMFSKTIASDNYPAINFNTAYATSRGLSLNRSVPDEEQSWIGGSEFAILLGTEQPKTPASIILLMRLPEFMTAKTQIITVIVNHHVLSETYSLDKTKDWTELEIPLPNDLLKHGNNQITLKFSESAMPENRDDWHTAGQLKSFKLVQ